MKKTYTVLDILSRIIAIPFYMMVSLIGAIFLWIKWNLCFIIYGGEAISYHKKTNRKTIYDVFEKLNNG